MGPEMTEQDFDDAAVRIAKMSVPSNAYGEESTNPGEDTSLKIHMVTPQTGNSKEPESAKSRSFNLNPFKSSRKNTKEGQPSKKRGPKPDSKPAATRRQELNRQAQRSHRERKEHYTKTMEDENVKLRKLVVKAWHYCKNEKSENDRLKQLLGANGIPFDFVTQESEAVRASAPQGTEDVIFNYETQPTPMSPDRAIRSPTYASSSQTGGGGGGGVTPGNHTNNSSQGFTSRSVSHEASASPQPTLPTSASFSTRESPTAYGGHTGGGNVATSQGATFNPINQPYPVSFLGVGGTTMSNDANVPQPENLDLNQIGIDFVVELERTCHDHISLMSSRTYNDNEEELGGHALMLTCPPAEHLISHGDETYPHQLPPGPKEAWAALINMSRVLPTGGGELTPVMAWQYIRQDERFNHLTMADFHTILGELSNKVRCYGFGAVVEMYEVQDILDAVFEEKEIALREFIRKAQSANVQVPSEAKSNNQQDFGGPRYDDYNNYDQSATGNAPAAHHHSSPVQAHHAQHPAYPASQSSPDRNGLASFPPQYYQLSGDGNTIPMVPASNYCGPDNFDGAQQNVAAAGQFISGHNDGV